MKVVINRGVRYNNRLSHHHIKGLERRQRSELLNHGYTLQTAIKYGIPIDAKELYDDAYVTVTDGENIMFGLYKHGFDCKLYSDGSVRYTYGDIKRILTKRDRQWIEKQVRLLRTELGEKYKKMYKK